MMNFIRNQLFLNRRLIQAFKHQKRYLNLLEYQSKSLLKSNGVAVQDFYTVDINGRLSGNQNLISDEYVIKAQILAGGRGKGHFLNGFKGGVHLTKSKQNVDELVKKMLGQKLITKQTTIDGVLVKTVMVAESVEIKDEKYICFVLDRSENGPVLIASPSGGVDIETVAKESPNLLKCYPIDVINGLSDEQCEDIIRFLKFNDPVSHLVKDQLKKLWKTFITIDAIQLEINPFAETSDNRIICVDSKIIIDDNAKFRQNDIFHYEDTINDELDKSEVEAIKSNLNYIRLNGNIGCLVNGAGLAMATMDLINYHGGKAANFLDVGGGVTENQVYKAFEIISKDSQVKVIFVNVFGGIVNCAIIAKGLVNAVKSLNLLLPIIVRLEGTNVDEAKVLIKDSGLNILIADNFDDGAKKAVNQSKILMSS